MVAWEIQGEWNDMATLFMNGMEAATRQLWHNNAHFSKVRAIGSRNDAIV